MDRKIIIARIENDFGFTRAMAQLYTSGLELGSALMLPLARQAGIKRTTAYYIMDELLRRGFFHKKRIGRRTYYIATSTENLVKMTLERERRIRKLSPILRSLTNAKNSQ